MTKDEKRSPTKYGASGTKTDWYRGWDLSEEERDVFRRRSRESRLARLAADNSSEQHQAINTPTLNPLDLMPRKRRHRLTSLSLFSGGGGLDLGFDLAGYRHIASYELLEFAGETLRRNRPRWNIRAGQDGDVTRENWSDFHGKVSVIHGGPPCQPFSTAGRQQGHRDVRDMFPEFVRAVREIQPEAFVAENVPGLKSKKFESYLEAVVRKPLLDAGYQMREFKLHAPSFGVPQVRTRLFFVGFRDADAFDRFGEPTPTHSWEHLQKRNRSSNQQSLFDGPSIDSLPRCMGAREALGLPFEGEDYLAPTIRSTLTGPRHTTSILSSTAAQDTWRKLGIWPNGVSANREKASRFPTKTGDFRLSVSDCVVMQGFPEAWTFEGPVYKALGQVGNSVAPPVAYAVATALAHALKSRASRTSSRSRRA